MIDMIVNFQEVCQQTNVLLHGGHTISTSCWKDASDFIVPACELLDRHRNQVSQLNSRGAKSDSKEYTFEASVREENNESRNEFEGENLGNGDDRMEELQEPIHVEIKEEEELLEGDGEMVSGEDGTLSDIPEPEVEQESLEEQVIEKKRGNRRKIRTKKSVMKSEKVICDTCGELVSQISLEGHLNRHLGVKPFVCEIEGCGRQLYSKYSLQQHRHLHKSINRYYDCPDCGKRIKGTNCWLRHKKLHTEEPKFSCDVCGKKFRRR